MQDLERQLKASANGKAPAEGKKGKTGKTPAEHKSDNTAKLQEKLDALRARLRPQYETYIAETQRKNQGAMDRATTITMLMLLQGQECTVTITPAQQGMMPMLGAGSTGDYSEADD